MKKNKKYQLILRSINNMEEKVIMTYRPKTIIVLFCCFVFLLVSLSFLLFNTVFSLWVNPYHYYGVDAKKMEDLQHIIIDLEHKTRQNDLYIKGVQEMLSVGASITKEELEKIQYDDKDVDCKIITNSSESRIKEFKFYSPFIGKVFKKYGDQTSLYPGSVVFKGHSQAPLTSIAEGFVVCSEYSTDNDVYITVIQHQNGVIAVYKHDFAPIVKSGTKIAAQELIAVVPKYKDGALAKNNLIFSMYIDGKVVNPEDYIKF